VLQLQAVADAFVVIVLGSAGTRADNHPSKARKQESKKARKQESKKARKQESKKARKQESKKARKQEAPLLIRYRQTGHAETDRQDMLKQTDRTCL
jgi:hypothetical protein